MIYLFAAIVGLGSGWLLGRLIAYLEKHTYNLRVKEIKDELAHSNSGTGTSYTE